jgi:hypothetical protein
MTQPPNMPPHEPPRDPYDTVPYQSIPFDRDAEHLRILSICWYVGSALAAFMGCVPMIHTGIGLFILLAPPRGNPPPAIMGWIFFIVGSAMVCYGWTCAILGFLTARSIKLRRRAMLCYIASALYCLQIPVGALLGIFTFIVLTRPSVKASFSSERIFS